MQAVGCKLSYPLSFKLSFCPPSLNSHIHILHVYIFLLGPFSYVLMRKTCILCSKNQRKCIWSRDVVYEVPRPLKEVFQSLFAIPATLFTLESLSKYAGSSAAHVLWTESIAPWQSLPRGCPWWAGDRRFRGHVQSTQQWKLVLSSVSFCYYLATPCLLPCLSFHSSLCLLLSQSSVSVGHLRCPFQEMMKY